MSTNSHSLPRKRGPRFKVNPAQAAQIDKEHRSNESTVDEIAARYGVCRQTIYNVLRRLRRSSAE